VLKTLADYSDAERADLLAKASSFFLPKPDLQTEPEAPSPVLVDLMGELASRAKVDPTDTSPPARAAILQVLVSELSQLLLAQSRVATVRARLGDRGELPPKQYRVAFDPSFDTATKRGIRRAHVEDALQSPDSVQHLPEGENPIEPRVSLYARRIADGKNASDPYVFLVHCRRAGDLQHVVTAWRVYLSDIRLKDDRNKPLDVLAAFLDVYGIEFTVRGFDTPRRLIASERFVVVPGEPDSELFRFESKGIAFEANQTVQRTSDAVEVALAYAVNVTRYLDDLRKHGVEISDAYWKSNTVRLGIAQSRVTPQKSEGTTG